MQRVRELGYERQFREWVAARGMTHERWSYPRPEAGGETLAHRFAPAVPPRARVVVAHGAGNDALFAFPGLFKELLLRGFEVFAFDLDGHGRASTTRFSAAVAGAIPAALDQARARGGALPTHLLGLSLGGAITLAALPALGERVASAVLISAPLLVRLGWRAVLGELRPGLLATALRQREHLGWFGLIPSFGPVKRGGYPLRLDQSAPGAFGYVGVLNHLLRDLDLEAAARATRIPVLLVYGDVDRLVPLEQGERLAGLIPRAELLRVRRGTHLTTTFAPRAWERILGWLDEQTAGSVRPGDVSPADRTREATVD